MLPKMGLSDGAQELPEFSRSYNTPEGDLVRARAFRRQRGGQPRYEILVDGFGQYAVVDVPKRGELARLVATSIDAFAASARLRGRFSVQLD